MRREELYLSDILEAADAIEKFLADIDKDAFINSDLIRSAVLQKLTIIGEATARLPSTRVLFYRLVHRMDNCCKRRP